MAQNDNPLRKYFRQPSVYISLPSKGRFYPQGTITMPPNGELPVMPMTAVDEITSRTPDALFNGSGVMDIIGSCVPAIRDPWVIPTMDLNTLLVAIRLASYGHEMSITSTCSSCGHVHDMTVDLRNVLDNMKTPNYDETVTTGDLIVSFSPMTYRQVNETSRSQFEDQKIIQIVNSTELGEEEKMQRLGEAFRKITELTIKVIAESIGQIKTPDALVTDRDDILEFLKNCPKPVFDQIKEHALELREQTDLPPLNIICDNCQVTYQQTFTLDMSNFFDNAS